jgi:hypothetical protein
MTIALAACVRTVPQEGATGKDGRAKGAKPLKLENNEGRGKGIVTYPGGDRVDWRSIQLPEGKHGRLEVEIKWTPPRPGLDLAFEVYDEFFERVAQAKPSPGSGRRRKSADVKKAEGKMYLMIYAPERGDAADYRIQVDFHPAADGVTLPPGKVAELIEDPPVLPALPEEAPPPDCVKTPGAPGCPPPDCAKTPGAPGCPPVGAVDCVKTPGAPGCPPVVAVDCTKVPRDPSCPALPPVTGGKITNAQNKTGGAIVTVNRGSSAGVDKGWKGQVVDDKGKPIFGGDFICTKVTASECVGSVTLTRDQVAGKKVVLQAP